MDLIIKLLVNAIAVFAFGYMLRGVHVKSFGTSLLVAILLALVNAFIRPIVLFLTLPFTIITFGLFILVVNTLMVMLVDWILDGFKVESFWWALLFSVLMSLVNLLFF